MTGEAMQREHPDVDVTNPERWLLSLLWRAVEVDTPAQVLVFDPGSDD